MPARDPETGQFVSAGGAGTPYNETRTINGVMHSEIPAADLSGGTTTEKVEGHTAVELIDFDSVLIAENEVFEVLRARLTYYCSAHTTATAEGYVGVSADVTTNTELGVGETLPPFFVGNATDVGLADIKNASARGEDTYDTAFLFAEPSVADSAAGLAAGANNHIVDHTITYRDGFAGGPTFDMDDSWFVPHVFMVDNISDHAVQFGCVAHLEGVVHDL